MSIFQICSVCNWPIATAPCDIREGDDEEQGDDDGDDVQEEEEVVDDDDDNEPSTRLPPSPTSMEPPLPPPIPPGEEDTDGSGCGDTDYGCMTKQKSLPLKLPIYRLHKIIII